MDGQPDLVCVAHLWWDWVWQRPQQLMTRLAHSFRVLYVEEPRIVVGEPLEEFRVVPEGPLDVGRLLLQSDRATFLERLEETLDETGRQPFMVSADITEASMQFSSSFQARLEDEVQRVVAQRRDGPLVLWLYTPVVVDFIDLLEPDLVVYDVMDDLTAFKFAPRGLLKARRELLRRADLVFTGGPSLQRLTVGERPDAHHFPSGVDRRHYAQGREERLPVAAPLRDLPHPIVGYVGVVDERLDYELLGEAVRLRPDWSWVLVGPLLKVEKDALPEAPNLHYLGKQSYEDLPAFLKGFDVAIMPFALNEATRSISPTKTLEYVAAGVPVVSTRIPDVEALYASVVRFGDDAERFVAAVAAAVRRDGMDSDDWTARVDALLDEHAWDGIAQRMIELVSEALAKKRSAA
jgi:UDP-galactopyranose mutase